MLPCVKTSVLAFAIASLTGVAWSGELVVDQKNPRADDKNPGTPAAPLKTIQAALDKARPGDAVQVRGAPKGARWFRMGFGVRNCSGWAAFNNFDIRTRPGENPHAAKVVLPSRWR